MSLDINVYSKKIDDSYVEKWISRMNQFDMDCEIHPDFSFKDRGFLPFKIRFKNAPNKELANKDFISGFEFYSDKFDFQKEIESIQPKRSLFQKLLGKSIEKKQYVNKKIDSKLKECEIILTFTWGSYDSLELRMVLLSSAILSELLNGICYYTDSDIWIDSETIVADAYKQIIEYENTLKKDEWKLHEFTGW